MSRKAKTWSFSYTRWHGISPDRILSNTVSRSTIAHPNHLRPFADVLMFTS